MNFNPMNFSQLGEVKTKEFNNVNSFLSQLVLVPKPSQKKQQLYGRPFTYLWKKKMFLCVANATRIFLTKFLSALEKLQMFLMFSTLCPTYAAFCTEFCNPAFYTLFCDFARQETLLGKKNENLKVFYVLDCEEEASKQERSLQDMSLRTMNC